MNANLSHANASLFRIPAKRAKKCARIPTGTMAEALVLILCSFFLAACGRQSDPPPLQIERKYRRFDISPIISFSYLSKLPTDKNGNIQFSIRMDPALLQSLLVQAPDEAAPADPFAAAATANQKKTPAKILTPREAFENAGIAFGPHGSATYDPDSLVITLIFPPEQARLLVTYFDSIKGGTEKQLFIQLDQFDMATSAAARLLNSAIPEGAHQDERDAAHELVRGGTATHQASAILARNACRSGISCLKDQSSSHSFSVEPVMSADHRTIVLKIHTPFLASEVIVLDQNPVLLGVHHARGTDISSVFFVTASVQSLGRHFVKLDHSGHTPKKHSLPISKDPLRQFVRSEPIHYRIGQSGEFEFEDGKLRTFYYRIPRWFFSGAGPYTNAASELPGAQAFFESKGLTFGDGAHARYDPETELMEITHRPAQMELLDAYLSSGRSKVEKQLVVKLETYRIHNSHARQVLKSVGTESDHKPERDAINNAVERGYASLENLEYLTVRGGHPVILGESVPDGKDEKSPLPELTQGRRIKFKPILGADNLTMELGIRLESASERSGREQIETQFTLHDGTCILIASWSNEDNTCTVIFASGYVQFLGGMFNRMEKLK